MNFGGHFITLGALLNDDDDDDDGVDDDDDDDDGASPHPYSIEEAGTFS